MILRLHDAKSAIAIVIVHIINVGLILRILLLTVWIVPVVPSVIAVAVVLMAMMSLNVALAFAVWLSRILLSRVWMNGVLLRCILLNRFAWLFVVRVVMVVFLLFLFLCFVKSAYVALQQVYSAVLICLRLFALLLQCQWFFASAVHLNNLLCSACADGFKVCRKAFVGRVGYHASKDICLKQIIVVVLSL